MHKQATFAAGCFWGVEAAYRKFLNLGIISTEVGYAGGFSVNPTYTEVCTGTTGHAESVRINYNPEKITYEKLLDILWQVHDPTQGNRQGNDIGSQYRSVIFYSDLEQRKLAEAAISALSTGGRYSNPITTTVEPLPEFYIAEDYHQQYLEKNPGGYCHVDLAAIS